MAIIHKTENLRRATKLSPNQSSWIYNGLDCCVTLEVHNEINPQHDNTTGATYQFSRALQAPVMEMSLRGLEVDLTKREETLALFRKQEQQLASQLDRIVHEGIGVQINWRSPKQLIWLFYDIMGLPVQRKRNAQGRMAPTVNRDAIETLSTYFIAQPICNHLLALRDLGKKISFLETEVDTDNTIRCSFNLAGTNTGRLASSMSEFQTGTNLQNVDRNLRYCFRARKGKKYANLDLEQADSRNVGAICWNLFHSSRGPSFAGAYLDACESGDLHTTVCKMAWSHLDWGTDPDGWREVADQIAYRNMSYRDLAKRLGHGTNYYGTPRTMAKHSKVEVRIIEEFQSRYFAAFPCIPAWHKWVRETVRDESQITTLLGRRRTFFGRFNNDATIREAIAYAPQSMTADEIDIGLLNLWRADRVDLCLQVHDSILFEYNPEEEAEIIPWALKQLLVPIDLAANRKFVVPTEAKVGWNWGDFDPKKPDKNPDGLIKWKGVDQRKRSHSFNKKRWSLWEM